MTEVYLEPCQTSVMENFAGVLKNVLLKKVFLKIS